MLSKKQLIEEIIRIAPEGSVHKNKAYLKRKNLHQLALIRANYVNQNTDDVMRGKINAEKHHALEQITENIYGIYSDSELGKIYPATLFHNVHACSCPRFAKLIAEHDPYSTYTNVVQMDLAARYRLNAIVRAPDCKHLVELQERLQYHTSEAIPQITDEDIKDI